MSMDMYVGNIVPFLARPEKGNWNPRMISFSVCPLLGGFTLVLHHRVVCLCDKYWWGL